MLLYTQQPINCEMYMFVHFQVGFIMFVCKPMYTTLHRLLPSTKPLLDGCSVCLENWKAVHEQQTAAAAGAT